MVKIQRYPVPPASLALESQKTNGSYSMPDVVQQLKEDSFDKCYLCELKGLTDPEVEHLKPHHGRTLKERVFDWHNLFYACPYCNKMKMARKYDDKIIDCCSVDPEKLINHIFLNNRVVVYSVDEKEDSSLTAELIQNCFENRSTGIREAACQHRVDRLAETMGVFYKTLGKYKKQPESKRYLASLRGMLSRESQFAAFKRYYIRQHQADYPKLQELVV